MEKTADQRRITGPWLIALPCLLVLFAIAAPLRGAKSPKQVVELIQAQQEIPEDELLDVGIQVFDHGLPQDEDELFELELEGIYEDVRKAEARYIPVRLTQTLQSTGFWGAVRVAPAATESANVTLSGRIVESTGKRLVLELEAVDASGRLWLQETYRQDADLRAYRDRDDGVALEPFQSLYHKVANDLLAARKKLNKSSELRDLRALAEIRFAAAVVPIVFADYLDRDREGRIALSRLPSEGDPMMDRVRQIRARDDLFVDTLTEHYSSFAAQMDESYRSWRRYSYEEERAKTKLKRKARKKKALGALAIAAGAAIAAEGGGETAASAVELAVIGGTALIRSGIRSAREARFHVEALRELAASFNAEVEPLLVDVEGHTLKLTGTVEKQYVEWRRLLEEIFAAETGLLADPDAGG